MSGVSKINEDKLIKSIARHKIKDIVRLRLYVGAGGMCEYLGCQKNLLEHKISRLKTNLGEQAHIVAYNEGGPRGTDEDRPLDINEVNNLMLLCGDCHKVIDDHKEMHSIKLLREYKKQHEIAIADALRGISSNYQRTQIVVFEVPISGKLSQIPDEHCYQAIRPNYPTDKILRLSINDLSNIFDEKDIYKILGERIKDWVSIELSNSRSNIPHYSVFALAPIPMLILFGNLLGRFTSCDFYNRQHIKDNWSWVEDAPVVNFNWHLVQAGSQSCNVALMVHTSGVNAVDSLPSEIDDTFSVYEICPLDELASKNAMQNRKSLENFKNCYEDFRRALNQQHKNLQKISLFPAVSPSVALMLGRELISKIDPSLSVYDKNKASGGFNFALEVNV